MKHSFFITLLSVGILIGCSHVQENKRTPASVKDVAVSNARGDVFLYYRDGGAIVVKTCEEARVNCQSEIRIPVESFKNELRNRIFQVRYNEDKENVKPLTPEDVDLYCEDEIEPKNLEKMAIELEKLNAYISENEEDQIIVDQYKQKLALNIKAQNEKIAVRERVNAKVDAEVDKVVNLISKQSKLTPINFVSDKDQLLYTVLKVFSPEKKYPCGLKGSVEERLQECSYQLDSEKDGLILVSRTDDSIEVYKDLSTGLLWSDATSSMTLSEAEKVCNSNLKEVAGISGVKWRLPSKEEYEQAEKSGIRRALPNMHSYFWSSTNSQPNIFKKEYYTWVYVNIMGQYSHYQNKKGNFKNSVRCVGD